MSSWDFEKLLRNRRLEVIAGVRYAQTMNGRRASAGFTLIEVLVVLAILVILAGALLPTFKGPRRALLPQCMGKQRQIGVALSMYASDSRNLFPNLDTLPGNDGPSALTLVTNYLNHQTNVFMCPFSANQRERDRPWYRARFIPELNAEFFRSNGNDYAYYDGLSLEPSTNPIVADRFAWTNRFAATNSPTSHASGRINATFADGHVETLRPDRILGTNLTPMWSVKQDPIRPP
jgi:prepilin-type N-terminal cleavage/methylation domain-containing protein/prepilin-type processing-associated H-X9-DG protein